MSFEQKTYQLIYAFLYDKGFDMDNVASQEIWDLVHCILKEKCN